MSLDDARRELRAYLAANDLPSIADAIVSAARPAIRLAPDLGAKGSLVSIGASKIGGAPDLPEAFVWPTRHKPVRRERSFLPWRKKPADGPSEIDVPLAFIAQIDLAACSASGEIDIDLPKSGLLSYFFDPDDIGGFCIGTLLAWHAPAERLSRRNTPEGAHVFPEFPLAPTQSITLPDSFPGDRDWSMRASDAYADWAGRSPDGIQLGGEPRVIQWPMEKECAQEMQRRAEKGTEEDRRQYSGPITDWRLVLQVDSSDEFGMNWVDGGRLYVWMHEADIRAGRFERAGTIVQFC